MIELHHTLCNWSDVGGGLPWRITGSETVVTLGNKFTLDILPIPTPLQGFRGLKFWGLIRICISYFLRNICISYLCVIYEIIHFLRFYININEDQNPMLLIEFLGIENERR